MKDKYFPDFIGQTSVKSKLGFYIDCYEQSKRIPSLLFIGEKGSGKTAIAKQLGRNLKKRQVLVNCTSINNIPTLLNEVLDPYQSEPTTIIFDECHSLSRDVQKAMLTINGDGTELTTSYTYTNRLDFWQINIDFTKLTFVYATTNKEGMNTAFVDRLEQVSMEPYRLDDIKRIIGLNCGRDIHFDRTDNVLEEIALLSRGNARDATKLSRDKIIPYCKLHSISNFGMDDLSKLKALFGVYDLGLNSIEFNILKILNCNKEGFSLTSLHAKTGMDRAAQQDAEKYLLKLNLIGILSGRRFLTKAGRDYIIKNG